MLEYPSPSAMDFLVSDSILLQRLVLRSLKQMPENICTVLISTSDPAIANTSYHIAGLLLYMISYHYEKHFCENAMNF